MDRIAILGASRGLGWALYSELAAKKKEISFFLSSRKIEQKIKAVTENTILQAEDFSKVPVNTNFVKALQSFQPTAIFYVAGGGPFGEFQTKKWSDHQWAINTSFLYPAELLHIILSARSQWSVLQQIIVVGSEIAENKPDPMAASYAAAKHALRGLISTLQLESVKAPSIELFSPGYMQTDLLPEDSWPKKQGLAESSTVVAKRLMTLIEKNNGR